MSLRPYKNVNVLAKLLVVLKIWNRQNQNNNRALQNSSGYITWLLYKDIQIQDRKGICYEISSGQLGFQFEPVRTRKSTTEDEVHFNAAFK